MPVANLPQAVNHLVLYILIRQRNLFTIISANLYAVVSDDEFALFI